MASSLPERQCQGKSEGMRRSGDSVLFDGDDSRIAGSRSGSEVDHRDGRRRAGGIMNPRSVNLIFFFPAISRNAGECRSSQ